MHEVCIRFPESRQGKRPEEMPVTIENPILNSPFVVPARHWRITDAQALQFPSADPKSVQIAKTALPKLRSETLSAQSGSIAVVSGATYTSKGWISSLQSALSKAGL